MHGAKLVSFFILSNSRILLTVDAGRLRGFKPPRSCELIGILLVSPWTGEIPRSKGEDESGRGCPQISTRSAAPGAQTGPDTGSAARVFPSQVLPSAKAEVPGRGG